MKKRTARTFISFLAIFTLILSNFSTMFTSTAQAEENVITVSEAIANNSGSATVEGYVVGHTKSTNSYDFEAPFANDHNIAIADSPTERDPSKIMPVQVTSNFRGEFALLENPDLVGKKIHVTGSLEAYFTVPGLKSPTSFELVDGNSEPDPDVPLETISITEAKSKRGETVQVEGVVTADNTAIGGGKLSTYIQDETAGINVFAFDASQFENLDEGDLVKIQGNITAYRGLTEIEPDSIEILEVGQALPKPTTLTISQMQDASIAEHLEGSLVHVNGFVKDIPGSPAGGGYNISFVDADLNTTTLRVMEGSLDVSQLEEGKWYDVTAILSQYDSYQLIPRKQTDLQVAAEQPEAPSPAGVYESTVASVVDGDTIHLSTPVLGTTKVRYVNIDTPETYHKPEGELDQNQLDHGNAAKAHLNEILKPGDAVLLKVGEEATDDYGRLLAQVIRKSDNLNTNLDMVQQGYASTYFLWPIGDEADYNLFQATVKEAKDAGKGIWNHEDPLLELPFEFRAREQGKGLLRYVGNSDTKEYVLPEDFEDVPVEKRIFFASAQEAEENGYVPVNGAENDNLQVQLLGVNDLHGKIDVTGNVDGVNYGRMDYLASNLREREATNPNTLIVHSGDMVGGSSPVSALLQDEPTVEMMESIGFDVGTVGNHEFDEGVAEMLRLINGGEHENGTPNYDGIDFPMVAANVEYKDTNELVLDPYTILQVDGEKIGFIGVATVDTPNMIIAKGNENVEFTDEVEAINKFVPELQAEGVEAIVVLAHVPGNQSGETASGDIARIATEVNDAVDVIFAAHNHVKVNAVVDNKLIVQAWEYGKAFADVDLEIDRATGDIVKKSAEIVDVVQEGVTPDPEVEGLLNKYLEEVGPKLNEVIGVAAFDMTGGYATKGEIGDNALGNLIADGMIAAMNSDFALMNGGGIRDDLNVGDITWNELFNIQPFGNTLVKLEITGDELKQVLNTQFSSYGPDVSVGGFSYTWDPSLGEWGEVVDIFLKDGSKIDSNGTYTVTVNNYMYPHSSDKYRLLELGENPVQGPDDLQATVDFVRGYDGPIAYEAEGRISEVTVVADTVTPVTTAIVPEADLSTSQYVEKIEVELNATDEESGVQYIEYSLDQGITWTQYGEGITISGEGTHTLLFRAVDNQGNVEAAKSLVVDVIAANLENTIELVHAADGNKGIKNSLVVQIRNSEKAFDKNEAKGYTQLVKLSEKVSKLDEKHLEIEGKNDIIFMLDYIVKHQTIN
ncbi:5'-nucleotidase C-terminal domain-containing protein [Fredinandcohnia sp. 179-A 10B2 NHS]|uniref:5'-nucleotidase C-terminal domain-containing protein n=1 Tax=Fredinandcohnia sp. 179-A 10B2 NHS TaxID=3235176 RepID=UPI00399F9F99